MRRTVIVAPGLLAEAGGESLLRAKLPAFERLAELGSLVKVAVSPPTETPEAMVLGLKPGVVEMRQGPLTVSALGFDPPERSTHFHLSLLSTDGTSMLLPSEKPDLDELETIMTAAKRLNTKLLTLLSGEELDHGLVWEALGDLGTTPPTSAMGVPMRGVMPDGDGDLVLRRLIDDSINLLSGLELNERRRDEGLPEFNVLWPWGHGVRRPVPNLALRRGEPAIVESASMRLAGLTRLAGYRHGDRSTFGKRLGTKLRDIAGRAAARDLSLIYIDVPQLLRNDGELEELEWFTREMDSQLLQPLLDDHLRFPSRIALLSPGESLGLAVTVETDERPNNIYPFDERSLEERTIPTRDLWTLVEEAVS